MTEVQKVELRKKNNKEEKGKEIPFAKGYFIFKDGRCWSEKSNKFLTKRMVKGKTESKYYYTYVLSKYGNALIPRLVMFLYAKHNYENIREMPKVVQIDGNPENLNFENLKFATQSEINKMHKINFPAHALEDKGTIKKANVKIIENLLQQNMTYKKISEIFETSEMSVYRFVKKYIKGKNTNTTPSK